MIGDEVLEILEEDSRRESLRRELIVNYDPIRGTEGSVPRFCLWVDVGGLERLWLPQEMLSGELGGLLRGCLSSGSLEGLLRKEGLSGSSLVEVLGSFLTRIAHDRIRYDFEYWCAECVVIKDKEARIVPFVLNLAQRESLREIEAMRLSGRAVRILELKGRQYGSTTMKSIYISWMQLVRYHGSNAYMISLDNDGARAITARYKELARQYPASFVPGEIQLVPYEGMVNTRQIRTTSAGDLGFVSIASAERPNAPSGRTIQMALISEAGKMRSSVTRGAEQLVNNITSMIPSRPGTVLMIESTADRTGKWFRSVVHKALQGGALSAYKFVFIPWLLDPSLEMDVEGDPSEFIRSWSSYERRLWDEAGATLRQIAWYRYKLREKDGDEWKMRQEYPTWVDDAFQTGAKRIFSSSIIIPHRSTCRSPERRGSLLAEGDTGGASLRGIYFEPSLSGHLSVWRDPGDDLDGLLDVQSYRYTNRYVAAMDVGGVWEGSDYTTIGVLDRGPTVFGGLPEIVAIWHGHLDQDLAAWEAARLSMWYERALLAVEVNSLKRDRGDPDAGLEPDHSGTVLSTIRPVYHNLYTRRIYDNERQEYTERLGFHTNVKTKPLIVNNLRRYLREKLYVERELPALMEMEVYVQFEDGTMGAESGYKDDRVMMRAILLRVHEEMPPVHQVDRKKVEERPVIRSAAMASF